MKIVHTSGSLEDEASGPSYSVPATARATQALGHDVHVMSIGPARVTDDTGFTHHQFDNAAGTVPVLRGLSLAPKMKRALRAQKPDIIHTQGLWLMPNIYAAQVARPQKTPFVITVRGMLAPAALSYSKGKKAVFGTVFQKRALASAQMLHATSEQEYRDIRSFGLTQPVLLAPNGIDIPVIKPRPARTQKTLLFFGRLHPIKGLDNLIEAWAALESSVPEWSLSLRGIGDESYIQSLNDKIQTLGLSRVTIGGGVYGEEKVALYQSADIYILPSQSENFGITVAESLASGTPVICTTGAPWSGLSSHDCGWWTDQDPQSLQTCLKEALFTPQDKSLAMGNRGREWMRSEFSWHSIALQLESAYEWLLGAADKPLAVKTE